MSTVPPNQASQQTGIDKAPGSGRPAIPMLFRGVNVVSLSVPDLESARDFYGRVLGFGAPLYDMPQIGWLEFATGGAGNLAVTTNEPEQPPGTRTTVVLNTEDCFATCAELRRRGVRCDDPVVVPGVVVYCAFYDPFGNRLQMCSDPPKGPGAMPAA